MISIIVSVYGYTCINSFNNSDLIPINDSKVIIYPGAKDNLPDEASQCTTLRIMEMLRESEEGDLIISLVSGGKSEILSEYR